MKSSFDKTMKRWKIPSCNLLNVARLVSDKLFHLQILQKGHAYHTAILFVSVIDKHVHIPMWILFFDFSLTVKAAPHECVIRTGQP